MMYNEFLTIAGLTEDEVSFDAYTNEIEPAYREMPYDLTTDKKAFAKWWKANRELCRFISLQILDKEEIEKRNRELIRKNGETSAKYDELVQKERAAKEKAEETSQVLVGQILDLEKNVNRLKIRAAFAPDELVKETRLEMFTSYEAKKAEAVELGIIKG